MGEQDLQEHTEPLTEQTAETVQQPPKRGRGRPKGSKNKKTLQDFPVGLTEDAIREGAERLENVKVRQHADVLAPKKKRVVEKNLRKQILKDIQVAILHPMTPREIIEGIREKYREHALSRAWVEKAIEYVQDQLLNTVGFAKLQLRELAERSLVRVLKHPDARPGEILAAIRTANDLFGIQKPDDREEHHEEKVVHELNRRIGDMGVEELEEFMDRLQAGRLDTLFKNNQEIDPADLAPRHLKRRSALAKSPASR